MAYEALTTTHYEIFVFRNGATSDGGSEERHEIVEVQAAHELDVEVPRCFFVNVFVGVSNKILYVYAPDAVEFASDELSLPVHQLHHDPDLVKTYIQRLLYSLINFAPTASEVIAERVASFFLQFTQQNTDLDFDAIVSIDNIRDTIMPPLRMDKLEKNNEVPDLGHCTICLDQIFDCQNTEAVKIPCGHVYHKPCILSWLNDSNSCPLCRTPLPLQDPASH